MIGPSVGAVYLHNYLSLVIVFVEHISFTRMLPVVSFTTSAVKVVNCSDDSLNSSLWQEIKKSKLKKKIMKRIMAVCGLKLSLNLYLKGLLLLEDYFELNAP